MSAKNLARRVELKLKFENVSVPADINKYLAALLSLMKKKTTQTICSLRLMIEKVSGWEAGWK